MNEMNQLPLAIATVPMQRFEKLYPLEKALQRAEITKEEIVDTALNLVREAGEQALNARSIAAKLRCSTQPVFSNFETMEDLHNAVKETAYAEYQSYLKTEMEAGKYPPYKASGMAYIRFAREEKELFKLLFMCDRSNETPEDDRESLRPLLELLQKNLGLSEDEAYLFHMETWICAHGMATMLATSFVDWDEAFISKVLTDTYEGIKRSYTGGKR